MKKGKMGVSKHEINRRSWNAEEDKILSDYIRTHRNTGWRSLPQKAGLNRCGKSCRLRWLNYLRPDVKHGNISPDEEELIVRMHRLLGNRWSLIAGRLPGRTDNEIKNYWNTRLSKRFAKGECTSFPVTKEESVPRADGVLARPSEMRSMGEEKKSLDASSIQLKNGHLQIRPEGGSQDSLESITSTLVGIPYTLDCNLFSMPCTDFPMGDLLPLTPLDLLYDNFII